MEAPNTTYINGFNKGYLIAKYLPKLSELLAKGMQTTDHPFVSGFVAGTNQLLQERTQDRLSDLTNIRKQEKDKDMERDIE